MRDNSLLLGKFRAADNIFMNTIWPNCNMFAILKLSVTVPTYSLTYLITYLIACLLISRPMS